MTEPTTTVIVGDQNTPRDLVEACRWLAAREVANYELTERLNNAEWKLRQLGYRRCTSVACNCKGYHFNG
jgi:hypothetical protein